MKCPISQLELFDRTHRMENGLGEFIDKKSKTISVIFLLLFILYSLFNSQELLISKMFE